MFSDKSNPNPQLEQSEEPPLHEDLVESSLADLLEDTEGSLDEPLTSPQDAG